MLREQTYAFFFILRHKEQPLKRQQRQHSGTICVLNIWTIQATGGSTPLPVRNFFLFCQFLDFNLLKPTGYVMHHQFNIQQLYALSTPYLCVLYLSENKQRLVPLTA